MRRLLAQINIGELIAPIDDPQIADFKNNLDSINALAEASDGFVWRLKDEDNNATSFNPYGDEKIIINMSVWESFEHLKRFVYTSEHFEFLKRRKEWFVPMKKAHMALWWISEEKMPDEHEGKKRLDHLWEKGPTSFSFDVRSVQKFKAHDS